MEPSRTSTSRPDTVIVHGEGVSVDRSWSDVPRAEAHHRFGGIDVPAAVAGALAALGALVVLGTLAASGMAVGYQQGLRDRDDLTVSGLAAGLVVLLLSGLVGGWVAGRSSRYDGVRNGLLAGILLIAATAGVSALARSSDTVRSTDTGIQVPGWVSDGATDTRALVTGLIAAAVLLLASALGGLLGRRWHRRVDDLLVSTRPGGITPYPDGER
jgi:hypothetical protein